MTYVSSASDHRETVVLLHGIWMRAAVTRTLGERLDAAGYRVIRIDYASVHAPFSEHFSMLDRAFDGQHSAIHIVGHSLGGVLAMHYLLQRPQLPPGRLVCLGSPLRGSMLAQRLERAGLGSLGLGHAREALTRALPDWEGTREVGVIAGTLALGMGMLLGPLNEPCDGTVAVRETQLPGVREHLTLRVSHTGLLYSKRTAEATVRFLRNGSFR